MKKILLNVGMSAADHGRLGELVAQAEEAGADCIHVDAADLYRHLPRMGLMWGPQLVEGIRPYTKLPIEVHANVDKMDERYVDAYAEAGANYLVLPSESYMGHRLAFMVNRMREKGLQPGLTVSPAGPVSLIENSIYMVDRVIVYVRDATTNAGGIYEPALKTIQFLRGKIDEEHLQCVLCTDGAANVNTVARLVEAGVDSIEASRSVWQTGLSVKESVDNLRNAIDEAAWKLEH